MKKIILSLLIISSMAACGGTSQSGNEEEGIPINQNISSRYKCMENCGCFNNEAYQNTLHIFKFKERAKFWFGGTMAGPSEESVDSLMNGDFYPDGYFRGNNAGWTCKGDVSSEDQTLMRIECRKVIPETYKQTTGECTPDQIDCTQTEDYFGEPFYKYKDGTCDDGCFYSEYGPDDDCGYALFYEEYDSHLEAEHNND